MSTIKKVNFTDGFSSEVIPSITVPTGLTGADGDITWEGDWATGAYLTNQAVHYLVDGQTYVCILNTTSNQNPLDGTYWELMCAKGDTGLVDWQGTWSTGAYIEGQSVYYATTGQSYICILDTTADQDPSNGTYWDVMSDKGDVGATGAVAYQTVTAVTSNITLADDNIYLVDTSAARSLTLPTPSSGLHIKIKDKIGTASTNNITLVRAGSENIEGLASSKVLQTNWGSWELISDGTDWFIL